jgi:DNA-binding winged helix-turn-helix (wHTH) protein
MTSSFSPFTNLFARSTFWGREKELSIIWGRLLSKPPQSVVVIGEPRIGKTWLVKHLIESPWLDEKGTDNRFTFVYLDCKFYEHLVENWYPKIQVDKERLAEQKQEGDMGNFAAALFWWDLYNALPRSSQGEEPFSEPQKNEDDIVLLDASYDISFAIEKWVQNHSQPVIFILDNFEGVARLPLRNSDRLRSIGGNNCAFILTSRYALYVLHNYHPTSWGETSPFYNIFSDPIYLGLLPGQEVDRYLAKAAQEAKDSDSEWYPQDTAFIRKVAGRHPELLRIACARMFEERLFSQPSSETEADEHNYKFLTLRLVQDGSTLCKKLWEGLANPELYGLGPSGSTKKEDSPVLSPYQLTLIDIAHGRTASNEKILFGLEQRGLIERANGKWRIFSEVLQQFVLMQEEAMVQTSTSALAAGIASSSGTLTERDDERSLTYKEGKVYDYLKAHLGDVCDKIEIMQAVWGEDDRPSNSALQKIIERIRDKIEDDPDSPYKLIAVRGRGYMLRRAL